MFVVTVTFSIKPPHAKSFHKAVLIQAHNSVQIEEHCHEFKVLVNPDDAAEILLYEVYTDRAAFDAHCTTDHFRSFSNTVTPWVNEKRVAFWHALENA